MAESKFEKILNFQGLVAPPVTPMHQDGLVNYGAIPGYVDYLVSSGVKGVYVSGATGEFISLSMNERKMIAEAWIKHGRGKLDLIIIHCGSPVISETKEMMKHAEDIGADGVACVAPSLLPPKDDDSLTDYLAEVAKAAPNTPFMYYHHALMTNIKVNMQRFLKLCCEKIPTMIGIKCTSFDLCDLYPVLKFPNKKLKAFYGRDWQLLGAMASGADAAVGTTYNFLGKETNEMIEAYKERNLEKAADIQCRLALCFVPLFEKYHGFAFSKLATSLMSGIDMGQWRIPMHQYSDKEIQEAKQNLKREGYLQ